MAKYYIAADGCDCRDGLTPETAWKTIDKANKTIAGGDTVCFRRGDTFYGHIHPVKGIDPDHPTTYTAYGEGAKPIVSQYKTALAGAWEDCGSGVWKLDLKDTSRYTGNTTETDTNVGFLKVDSVIYPRNRFAPDRLEVTWDYWNDDRYVYVKTDADPASLAADIKLACNIHCVRFADNLLVENIVFLGTGAHGICGTVHHATVRNCEFHEIGGSQLPGYPTPNTRYGNGVECWSNSSDVLVENCRFSGIYDVAITMQGNEVKTGWVNMTFRGNVMWNCQQCFEIWSSGKLPDTGFQNCVFENNVCIDSGYCWGYDVRPNKACSAHLLLYGLECPLCDIVIRNNTFYRARVAPIFKSGGPGQIPADYRITDNTFFVEPGQDIAWRQNCGDAVYDAYLAKLTAENHILPARYTDPADTL
ncbi:MAG: right-handed parallel beta-helix repeat-containing protein [Clostridia bacterium]|nr:right-handed parallel beta-helix repeat-containing protein [Clostridia bacterium]